MIPDSVRPFTEDCLELWQNILKLEDGATLNGFGKFRIKEINWNPGTNPWGQKAKRAMPISDEDGKEKRFRWADMLASCFKIVCFGMHSGQTRVTGIEKCGIWITWSSFKFTTVKLNCHVDVILCTHQWSV